MHQWKTPTRSLQLKQKTVGGSNNRMASYSGQQEAALTQLTQTSMIVTRHWTKLNQSEAPNGFCLLVIRLLLLWSGLYLGCRTELDKVVLV